MNSRLLRKGLLSLIGTASVTTVVALRAALPPVMPPAADPAKSGLDDTANPYSIIVERNIFHLNPPPPPPEPEKPKVELPVVKITGIIKIGNVRRVLFVSTTKEKKEPVYYSLVEGEHGAEDKLILVKIHDSADAVDVINDGTPVTLTVKDDSLGATPVAAAPAPPGGPPAVNPGNGIPGRPMFQPGKPSPPGAPGRGPNGFSSPMRRRNLP